MDNAFSFGLGDHRRMNSRKLALPGRGSDVGLAVGEGGV